MMLKSKGIGPEDNFDDNELCGIADMLEDSDFDLDEDEEDLDEDEFDDFDEEDFDEDDYDEDYV